MWECSICTFLNNNDNDICQICAIGQNMSVTDNPILPPHTHPFSYSSANHFSINTTYDTSSSIFNTTYDTSSNIFTPFDVNFDMSANVSLFDSSQNIFSFSPIDVSGMSSTINNFLMDTFPTTGNLEGIVNQVTNQLITGITNHGFSQIQTIPKTVEDLAYKLLFEPYITPHYCIECGCSAVIRYTKILDMLVDRPEMILRTISNEDVNQVPHTDRGTLLNDVVNLLESTIVPIVFDKLADDIAILYDAPSYNTSDGINLVWSTIHQDISSETRLNKQQLVDALNNLVKCREFQLYVNQNYLNDNSYNHPASKEVIDSMPVMQAKDSDVWEKLKDEKCAICQELFEESTMVMVLKCHVFCAGCITPWLQDHSDSCPICRNQIK